MAITDFKTRARLALTISILALCSGCLSPQARPGDELLRDGDEIVICGRLFHTGTRVVLWTDPGGYDAYRINHRFGDRSLIEPDSGGTPNRFSDRKGVLDSSAAQRVADTGWTLSDAQAAIRQFVMHYDVCGTSQRCFQVLHDDRGLSVHFMIDIDGTIYQTLDVKERAWHAAVANDASVGVEIANMGAYPDAAVLAQWYRPDGAGQTSYRPPSDWRPLGERIEAPWNERFSRHSAHAVWGCPRRAEPVTGMINGRMLTQYDFTPQQYDALARLTACLARTLPRIKLTVPREADGTITPHVLSEEELRHYDGLLGHYHVSDYKSDPGPAFDWDYLIAETRRHLP